LNKYYCDKSGITSRKWDELCPGSEQVSFHEGEFCLGGQVVTSGLVLVHRTFIGEPALKSLPNIVEIHSRMVVVVISGRYQSESVMECPSRLYYRKAAVHEGVDGVFHSRLSEFIKNLEAQPAGEPLIPGFHILDLDMEHVLACYVCALGGVAPLPEWKTGFEREVGYWQKGKELAEQSLVTWTDSRDPRKLRRFLSDMQGLLQHPTPPVVGSEGDRG
jgi:hypothetical protein